MALTNIDVEVQKFIDSIGKLSDATKVALSKIIWKDNIEGGDIKKYHNIISGVTCNTPIPKGDRGKDWEYMKSSAGLASQCDENVCDVAVTFSTKLQNPVPYSCSIPMCFRDLECEVKDYFGSEKCNDADPRGTVYASFVSAMVGTRLQNSHWTKTYFANTGLANLALSGHDGLFVQYLAIAPSAVAAPTQRIEISENALATYALQEALAADRGYQVYSDIVKLKEKHRTLRKRKGMFIKSTRALAQNYLEWLRDENQNSNNCCDKDPTTGIYDIDKLTIYGYKIQIVDEWDEIIEEVADFNDGTRWDSPHRAVMTYKENEPISTCDSGELADFELKYHDYTNESKWVSKYTFDVNIIEDEDFILAM